jgi:hypothetical protein
MVGRMIDFGYAQVNDFSGGRLLDWQTSENLIRSIGATCQA